MTKKPDHWHNSTTSEGNTSSERYLIQLAKQAFLSLWSYPNIYTNEGRRNKGDGKELCDLLIIFGNDVILFSDKDCEFTAHDDINVAWYRWYRRAIEKSVKQLKGAESWINRFPDRLYLDKNCEAPLPIKLPPADKCRIHLIAVTRGSANFSKSYWGETSSGSLFIDTTLVADQHKDAPFRIGWAQPNKRFTHVLDETTLDIVLNELDTISDFIDYLTRKEELFCIQGVDCIVPGEEELLALYLSHYDYEKNEHYFPNIPEGSILALGEGDWHRLLSSSEYLARRDANAISYAWDSLIEFQSHHIIHGNAISLADDKPIINGERLMRVMASENRLTRRSLGEALHAVNNNIQKDMRFTRTIVSTTKTGRAYVFMSLYKPDNMNFDEYHEMRRNELILYADGCKLRFKNISEVIGIVFEPGQRALSTVDFLLINFGPDEIEKDFANQLQEQIKDANMWKSEAIKTQVIRESPFPESPSLVNHIKIWFIRKLIQLNTQIKKAFR